MRLGCRARAGEGGSRLRRRGGGEEQLACWTQDEEGQAGSILGKTRKRIELKGKMFGVDDEDDTNDVQGDIVWTKM